MQSSIFVVSTGSGPLFWVLSVADCLPPSSMMSSSTAERIVLLMRRECPSFIPYFWSFNVILPETELPVVKRTHIVLPARTRNQMVGELTFHLCYYGMLWSYFSFLN